MLVINVRGINMNDESTIKKNSRLKKRICIPFLIFITASILIYALYPRVIYEFGGVNDSYAYVKGYKGLIVNVEIKSMYKGKSVKTIGNGAFDHCRTLKSVILPNTLRKFRIMLSD
jgi:hypothetical protein